MAIEDDTKFVGFPTPFAGLSELACCYEAVALLVQHECGYDSPGWVLLENLNRQFGALLEAMDERRIGVTGEGPGQPAGNQRIRHRGKES